MRISRRYGGLRSPPGDGYTLVAAVVLIAVVSVLIAMALPSWTQVIQRDKEEELIFRGMQYAEAIRIFQQRFGRYPMRLDELISVNPRCIRQLWKDPMTKNGEWGLIYAQGAGGGPGARGRRGGVAPNRPQQGAPVAGGSGPSQLGGRQGSTGRRSGRAVAPILGVHSVSSEKSIKQFAGGQSYSDWLFTADLFPAVQPMPGSLNIPRSNAAFIGRPFPPDLGPQSGGTPTTLQQGTAPSQEIQRSRRKRNGN
jgi:type II secretory pathway pseudopilin PulG